MSSRPLSFCCGIHFSQGSLNTSPGSAWPSFSRVMYSSGFSSSVVRLHADARHGSLRQRGLPLLALLQPAGLRAVGSQRQRGGVHLQLPRSVQQLHSDGTEDVDG